MSKDTATDDTKLIEKLKKYKAAHSGMAGATLPETGVKVTWPEFKPHSIWSKAMRLAKKSPLNTTDFYLPLLCKFDGEHLTIEEFKKYIPTDDIMFLTGEVMGDDDETDDEDGDDMGNAQP